MQVILLSDVARLGQAGQKLSVKDGYGRNFLLPQGLAVPATAGTSTQAQQRVQATLRAAKAAKEKAQELARRIEAADCSVAASVGEQGKLHGAVTAADIVEALKGQGIELDKHQIALERPLTHAGEFPVTARLHADVRVSFKVIVVPK